MTVLVAIVRLVDLIHRETGNSSKPNRKE